MPVKAVAHRKEDVAVVAPATLVCRVVDEFGIAVRSGGVSVDGWGLDPHKIEAANLAMSAPGVFRGEVGVSAATSVRVRFESESGGSEQASVKLAPGRTTSVDLVSLRKTKYKVVATLPDGTPIGGARVAIDRLPVESDPLTDASGVLHLELGRVRGGLGCWVFAPDGAVGKSELTFPLPGEEIVWRITCRLRLAELQVSIRSAAMAGQRLLKVGVRTNSPLPIYDMVLNGPPTTISVVDDGLLQVIILDPDTKARHRLSWPSASVAAPSGTLNIELDDKSGAQVRVVNERGDPLAGVALKLVRADGSEDPDLASAMATDDEGMATWMALKPGRLRCVRPGKTPAALTSFTVHADSSEVHLAVLAGWLPVGGVCQLPPGTRGYVVLPRPERGAAEVRVKVRDGKWIASAPGSVGDTLSARLRIRGFGPEEATQVVLGRADNVIPAPGSYPVARLRMEFEDLQRFSGYLVPESDAYKPRRRKAFLLRQEGPVIELPGVPPGTYHFSLWRDPLGRRDLVARTDRSVVIKSGEVSEAVLVRR